MIKHPAFPEIEWEDMDPYRQGAEDAFVSFVKWLKEHNIANGSSTMLGQALVLSDGDWQSLQDAVKEGNRKPLSRKEQIARTPLRPHELVDALQDSVHETTGHLISSTPIVMPPEARQ